METPLSTKILTTLTLSCLLLSALVVSGSQSCSAAAQTNAFTGGECTAEVLSAQTLWMLDTEHPGVMNQKLMLVAVVFIGLLFTRRILTPKVDVALRTWTRSQQVRRSHGYLSDHIFLPYLFATHGL